jgi:hypothetical protein
MQGVFLSKVQQAEKGFYLLFFKGQGGLLGLYIGPLEKIGKNICLSTAQ